MDIGLVTAVVSAFLLGGVALGWVASVGWERSLGVPAQYRSIAYVYGCGILLLCLYVVAWVTGDWAAFRRECAVFAICGAWTIITHGAHAIRDWRKVRATRAAIPAASVETGEGNEH